MNRVYLVLIVAVMLIGCPAEPDVEIENDVGVDGNVGSDLDADPGEPDADPEEPDADPGEPDTWEPEESPLTANEQELYDLINAYRVDNGLPEIPLSYSLTVVARAHVQDLIDHGSEILIPGQCNLHSWSDYGPWTGCCYDPDHSQAACMWNKPSELTNYTGHGFEISVSGAWSPQSAMSAWQGSAGHNAVILNQGQSWSTPWLAMGVGIDGGYSHVWFGRVTDPDDFP